MGEVAPTLAVHVNVTGLLTAIFADNDAPTTLLVYPGLHDYRLKQVVAFTGTGGGGDFFAIEWAPAVVGLY